MTGEHSPVPPNDPAKAAIRDALVLIDDALSLIEPGSDVVRRQLADATSCLVVALNVHDQQPRWKSAAEVDATLEDLPP